MTTMVRNEFQPRIHFDLPVSIRIPGESKPLIGQALNLSRSGIFVRSKRVLAADTKVGLRFSLPDGEVVAGDATVMRGESLESQDCTSLAFRFDTLAEGCGELLQRFLTCRLRPADGQTVRLQLGELGFPIRARAHSSWSNVFTVDAELPFLRLGSPVAVPMTREDDGQGQGSIRWVSVHVPPENGIPRINIGIEMDPDEHPVEVLGDDDIEIIDDLDADLWDEDPVCTAEFARDSLRLDRVIREVRRRRASDSP